MCVGIPMKIDAIDGELGIVEEEGVRREVSLALVEDPKVGDYVIVHAGYAIQRLDPEEALETLELLRQAGLVGEAGGG
jgi:hydrogenase expression/formation protein HypC